MPGTATTRTWESNSHLDAPAKYRRACRYDAFIPDELARLALQIDATVAGVAAEAEAAIRDLNVHAAPALAPFARLLLRTESIASSKVEGMQMDIRDLARAEARMETGGKVKSDALEILANIDAMELAIDEAARVDRFGRNEVIAIHRRLMEKTELRRIAGQIRSEQNWIGGNNHTPCGADFVPPPPEDVDRLMEDLYTAINDDLLPPILQAALVHAQFETIHPFADGNGRTGRALIHVVLRRRGVAPSFVPPISVVLANSKDRYIRGLTSFRGEDVEPWIEHFAAAAVESARLALRYVDRVGELVGSWKQRLAEGPSAPRSDAAAWALIDQLPAYPIVTAPVAAAALGRSKPQTYRAIEQLEEVGVLAAVTNGRRNQAWEAVGLLEVLAGMEGE